MDASFTDAVTGTADSHVDLQASTTAVDNLPGPRGLNVVQGMGFIPGPWISIFISKKVGTVASGYESFTGQIVAPATPAADPFLNLFAAWEEKEFVMQQSQVGGDGRLFS